MTKHRESEGLITANEIKNDNGSVSTKGLIMTDVLKDFYPKMFSIRKMSIVSPGTMVFDRSITKAQSRILKIKLW